MLKKLANSATHSPITGLTGRGGILVAVTLLAMLLFWSIDSSAITIFLDPWRYPTKSNFEILTLAPYLNSTHSSTYHDDQNDILPIHNNSDEVLVNPLQNVSAGPRMSGVEPSLDWVSVELEENYTLSFISRYLGPRDEPCKASKTVDIKFLNFHDGRPIVLSTGHAHEVVFQALDASGNVHGCGGDYFEIDVAGERWRSRPPTRDFGNGTHSFILQVHPHFAGIYNVTIILLFRNFGGLHHAPLRLVYDKQLQKVPVMFSRSEANLPDLHLCQKQDFNRDVWVGRWTRHAKNGTCEISDDGRYRCLEPDYPCTKPWCSGSLGLLESNGWVYSAHCSFRLFSVDDAWNCLNNRWLFFWGDSTHVDTVRNMLFFILGFPFQDLQVVGRRFDKNFTNPKDRSQSMRMTQIWNGHWNVSENRLGLKTLSYKKHRDLLKSFFNGSTVPDTIVFNSGLHDAGWRQPSKYAFLIDQTVSFWKDVIEGSKKRGFNVPNFIFRSTVTTAGKFLRYCGSNPSKMEVTNAILLDKLKAAGLVTTVIDYFDMTWAWHFDLRSSDGLHYGRFPSKSKWKDGQIGHQYFVDLMLGHVILNAICPA